jgi:hypothetical protein
MSPRYRFEHAVRSRTQRVAAHCARDGILPTVRARSSGPYRWTTAAAHPPAEYGGRRFSLEKLRSQNSLRVAIRMDRANGRQVYGDVK